MQHNIFIQAVSNIKTNDTLCLNIKDGASIISNSMHHFNKNTDSYRQCFGQHNIDEGE